MRCTYACRQLLRGASCRGPPTTPASSQEPTSSHRLLRHGSLNLPPALQEELRQPDPPLAAEVKADVIERNLPRHTVFEPHTDLMPLPDVDDGGADGSASGAGEGSGVGSAESAAMKATLAALPRQTPPEPLRVSAEEFDAMEARGEVVGVHSVLFRHEHARCRIGALVPSCLQLGLVWVIWLAV